MIELELEREKMESQMYKVILCISMCGVDAIIIYDKPRDTKMYEQFIFVWKAYAMHTPYGT